MKVLVINAGSSSLKYQLIDVDSGAVIAKGLCERIGIDGSKLTYKPTGKDSHVFEKDMKDHARPSAWCWKPWRTRTSAW